VSFRDLAAARRTAHKYTRSDVEHEVVLEALGAALLAPNHRHTFPWHFVVVGRQTRTALAERVFAIKKSHSPEIGEDQRQAGLDSFLNPAALVVFAQKRSDNEFQRREDYATLSCAIQNFTLSLAEKSLMSKWSTAAYIGDAEIYRLLDIDEAQFEIVGFVWAGQAAGELPDQRRPFLSEVLRVLP
jgi:nitroreductase